VVLVECAVLAMHSGRCPITDLAGRYTENRTDNSDIYPPLWLARRNQMMFGRFSPLGNCSCSGCGCFPSGESSHSDRTRPNLDPRLSVSFVWLVSRR